MTALIFGVLLDHVGITAVGISVAFLIVLGQVLVAVAVQIQSYGLLVGARLIFGAGYCPLLSTISSLSCGSSCFVVSNIGAVHSVRSSVDARFFLLFPVAVAVHFVAIWFRGPQMAFAFGIFLTSIRLGDFFIYGVGKCSREIRRFFISCIVYSVTFVCVPSLSLVPLHRVPSAQLSLS